MTARPQTSPDSLPLWQGYDNGELRLPRCRACGHHHLPPGPVCPMCFDDQLDWIVAGGGGTISTWVVVRRKYFDDFDPPYLVVQVELAEGPRLIGGMPMSEVDNVAIGRRVTATFETAPNGMRLPSFRLVRE